MYRKWFFTTGYPKDFLYRIKKLQRIFLLFLSFLSFILTFHAIYFSEFINVCVCHKIWFYYYADWLALMYNRLLCKLTTPRSRGLQGDIVYLSWPIAPLVYEPKCGWRGPRGDRCGLSANEKSCAHHVTWSPKKLWRRNSIFNLCRKVSPSLSLSTVYKVCLSILRPNS